MSVEAVEASSDWRAWARWSGAAFVVLIAHLAGAWVIAQRQAEASSGEAAPAIMVELAPLPVAPASEPIDVAPGPVNEAQPEPVSESPEAPPEAEPPPEPENDMPPPPSPAEPVSDEPEPISSQPDTELQVPEAPPVPEPEVVLPKAKPPEKPPVTKPPKREAPKRTVQRPRPVEKAEQRKQSKPQKKAPTAPPRSQAAPVSAPAAPAPGVAAASSASPANWRGALLAHLNRAKRYPSEARMRREEGTVRLTFSIDRSGRVTGYQVVGSSGSATLDQEALAMIQRASPLPAPPPEVPGSRISLTVPVRFNLN